MTGPNEELMCEYGTEVVEKTASGSPFAAKLLFAMMAMRMARDFAEDQTYQRLQAKSLNDRFQQLQNSDLAVTRDALQHSRPRVFVGPNLPMGGPQDPNALQGVPLGWDEGMVRTAAVADAVGGDLAKTALGIPQVQGALQRGAQAVRGAFQSGATKRLLQAAKVEGVAPSVQGGSPFRVAPKMPTPTPPPAAGPGPVSSTLKGVGRGLATAGALGVGAVGMGAFAAGRPALGYLSREQDNPTYGATANGAPQLAYGVNQWGQPQLGAPFIQ